jgi:hypothetical protein
MQPAWRLPSAPPAGLPTSMANRRRLDPSVIAGIRSGRRAAHATVLVRIAAIESPTSEADEGPHDPSRQVPAVRYFFDSCPRSSDG